MRPFFTIKSVLIRFALSIFCLSSSMWAQSVQLPENLYQSGEPVKKLMGCPSGFCEGPAADAAGNIYFSAFGTPAAIWKFPANGVEPTTPFKADGETNNGIWVDVEDRILVAQLNKVTRFEKDGSTTILAKSEGALDLKKVNDLTTGIAGQMYFTNWDGGQVFYRSPEGKVREALNGLGHANGIFLIEEDSIIYVNDDQNKSIYVYKVKANGDLGDRKSFAQIPVPDGMTVDTQGNVYVASHTDKKVYVFSKDGQELGTIDLSAVTGNITNVTFGGKEDKTLYITSDKALWAVTLKIPGRRLSELKKNTPIRSGALQNKASNRPIKSVCLNNKATVGTMSSLSYNVTGQRRIRTFTGVNINKL